MIPFLQTGYDVQWTGPDQQIESPNTPAADNERMRLALDGCALTPA